MTVTTERSTRDVKLRLRGRQPATCGFWADFVAEMTCPRVGSWSHGLTEINGAPSWLKSINRVLLRTDGINAMRAGIWQPRRAFTQSRWTHENWRDGQQLPRHFPPTHIIDGVRPLGTHPDLLVFAKRDIWSISERTSVESQEVHSPSSLYLWGACPAGSSLSEPNPTHPACSTAEVVLK